MTTLIMPANYIMLGDNLDLMRRLPDNCIKAIYFDPQFNSNADYFVVDEEEQVKGFEDIWKGGVNSYKLYIKDRLIDCRRVLENNGSIFFHCDPSENYNIRTILNEVFGSNNYINEIVWCYYKPGIASNKLLESHDTIYRYSKTEDYFTDIDAIRLPYNESTKTNQGKKFKKGQTWSEKVYDLDPRGKIPEDFWIDIGQAFRSKREYLRFPTQKPEKLLERIIKMSTKENDIVLEPFMGSGTACAVAKRLGRYYIGMEFMATTFSAAKERIMSPISNFTITECSSSPIIIREWYSYKELKEMEWEKFEKFMIEKLGGILEKKGKQGIDGRILGENGIPREIIQVKHWKDKVGPKEVLAFVGYIQSEGLNDGTIVAFDFTRGENGAEGHAARIRLQQGINIKLKKPEDIIKVCYEPKLELISGGNCVEAKVEHDKKIVNFIWTVKKDDKVAEKILFDKIGKQDFSNLESGEYEVICKVTDIVGEDSTSSVILNIIKELEKVEEVIKTNDAKLSNI